MKSVTIPLIISAVVAFCNNLNAQQDQGSGKIVISAVLYRISDPEYRELFTKFTYYIKDSLVLRKEDPNDTTLNAVSYEANEHSVLKLESRIVTPIYLIDLKTTQVYTYSSDSIKIDKRSDLETFMDDIAFKAGIVLRKYSISNIDTTSTIRKNIANVSCFVGKAEFNGLPFEFAYTKEKLPVTSPLNAYVPGLPYQVLWVSMPEDHGSDIVSELIFEEISNDLPHFVENYLNSY
ncbi:hypothetical protein SAMN05421747_1024 [Parapedobacter composti]|uniref:Uncharacterized protein n=1 Tax=Parapedobacter composti TaxID=623281 RepID=A0A1I1EUJ5_9SPHI|nr:hypothetical protein [Parapedobacter composti]SFB90306.1 hypothetical protein SAMN05421747_1024 [Parapedobacter composti]